MRGTLLTGLVAACVGAVVAFGGGSVPARGQALGRPAVTTGSANGLHLHSARLGGTVDPGGLTTSYRFEYGRTTNYGSVTPPVDVRAGFAPVPAAARVSGLAKGTTFHYRLVANNVLGTAVGADRTFASRDPRVGGRYRVRLRVVGGGLPFGQRAGTVVHRAYRFHPRCRSRCGSVRLVREGKRGRYHSTLRRARSGVYVGTERFHGGRCNDGLRFHTTTPIRIAVKRTSGDHASRIHGHLEVKLGGCTRATERVRLRGRTRG
jgi:hypothetical protein